MSDVTSLRLKKSTHDRLAALGTLNDSFDSTINRLIDSYGRTKRTAEWSA